jgi:hypothetical protein
VTRTVAETVPCVTQGLFIMMEERHGRQRDHHEAGILVTLSRRLGSGENPARRTLTREGIWSNKFS